MIPIKLIQIMHKDLLNLNHLKSLYITFEATEIENYAESKTQNKDQNKIYTLVNSIES